MPRSLILILAYHYPPENEIGGARPFRFAKYLSKMGHTCRIITAAPQFARHDPNIEHVPDPFLANSHHAIQWQMERAIRKIFLPGELGIQWARKVYRVARKQVRRYPGACVTIISTSPPLGPHLAALRLARDCGMPWIADFRDPFTENLCPIRFQFRRMPVLKWLEHAFLKNASAVIANTDAAMLSLAARFPTFRRKLQFICNGFDPENPVPPLPIPSRDRKILSHVGELYFGRNPRLILESIARLIEEGRLDGRKIGVKLVGKIADRSLLCQQAFLAAKAQGWLELKPEQVSQVDARHTAQTSDGLFLIQPQSDTQVPGKLFEYLRIGRPVLALIKRGSASERILEKSGVRFECVYPNSSPEETDRAVYRFFNLPSAPVAPSPWFEEHFNAENQVRILDQLICGFHVESPAQRKCRAIRGEGVPVPSCRHDLRSAD